MLVLAVMKHSYTVSGINPLRVASITELLKVNSLIVCEVLQIMVYPVMMPLECSGTCHEAKSEKDPAIVITEKFLGADGTRGKCTVKVDNANSKHNNTFFWSNDGCSSSIPCSCLSNWHYADHIFYEGLHLIWQLEHGLFNLHLFNNGSSTPWYMSSAGNG